MGRYEFCFASPPTSTPIHLGIGCRPHLEIRCHFWLTMWDQDLKNGKVETSSIVTGVSRKNHVDLEHHPIEGKKVVVGVDMNIDHGQELINNEIDLLMYDNNTIKRMKRRRKGQGQSRHQHDMHVIWKTASLPSLPPITTDHQVITNDHHPKINSSPNITVH